MKKIILALGGLSLAFGVFAQPRETVYADFQNDSTYYLIGDQVNVRLDPDTASQVMVQLPIGEKITITENTMLEYTKNGYTANWYHIRCNYQGKPVDGYIWGGMIASTTVASATDPELLYMYAVNKVIEREYFNEVHIQLRVCKNQQQLAKLEVKAVGGLQTYSGAESLGPKGVPGVKDIFKINFSDGFCAGAFGDAYFFWDGNKIYHVKTLSEGFDAPYYSTNEFIFPEDSKNKKGYIINKSESGYQGDDSKEHIEDWEKITYAWKGGKLIEIKKEKMKQ
jgi:hypothetical protein